MIERLTVFFLALLLLAIGIWLTVLPWFHVPLVGDWENNFFASYLVFLTGAESLRDIFASGWFRGAVSGLGIFNIIVAFYEIAHFQKSVSEVTKEMSS